MIGAESSFVNTFTGTVAFAEEVDYSIGKVGRIPSLIAGGEGLVMKFRGNGHVWIQPGTWPTLRILSYRFCRT